MDAIVVKIIELVRETIGNTYIEVVNETKLFSDSVLIDSFNAIKFIVKLEEEFKIIVDDDDLDFEKLSTPIAIAHYVKARMVN